MPKVKLEYPSLHVEMSPLQALCDDSSEATRMTSHSSIVSQSEACFSRQSWESKAFRRHSSLFENAPFLPESSITPVLGSMHYDPFSLLFTHEQYTISFRAIKSPESSFSYVPPSLVSSSVTSSMKPVKSPYYRVVTALNGGMSQHPSLYIGEESLCSEAAPTLDTPCFDSVLCCSTTLWHHLKSPIGEFVHYEVDKRRLSASFVQSTRFITQQLSAGLSVLLCCKSGRHRSACHLTAFLMQHEGMTMKKALDSFSVQAIAVHLDELEMASLALWEVRLTEST